MEKPFLAFETGARRVLPADDDRASENQRFYDRMTMRGIRVVRDDEASDTPVWRGDHTFSSDAATYSLMKFIEPEVAAEHPDWTAHEVKTQARKKFEKRLAQDLSYEQKEARHIGSTLEWKAVETVHGTQELATRYGDSWVTLNELWQHTKEYADVVGNPDAYNATEHQAQLAMQDAFTQGDASGFVSTLSHPDSIRYVQVWERSSDGITSRQIDLFAAAGRDLSHEEGKSFIERLSDQYSSYGTVETQEDATGYAHFFVRDIHIDDHDIRAFAQQEIREEVSVIRREQSVSGGFAAHRDGPVSPMRDAHSYVKRALRREIDIVLYGTRMAPQTGASRNASVSPEIQLKKTQKDTFTGARAGDTKETSVAVSDSVSPVSETAKTAAHPEDPMKLMVAEWWVSETVLTHAPSIPSGAHAALYWLTRARDRVDTPAASPQVLRRVEPYNITHEAPVRLSKTPAARLARIVSRITTVLFPKKNALPVPEPSGATQDKKPAGRTIFASLREALDARFSRRRMRVNKPPPPERRKEETALPVEHVIVEERRFILRMVSMIDHISGLMKAGSQDGFEKAPFGRLPVPDTEGEPEQSVPSVGELLLLRQESFGFLLWVLLRHDTPTPAVSRPGEFPNEQETPVTHTEEDHTPSSWVLLAIIWNLVMIREMGHAAHQGSPAVTQTKRAKPPKRVSTHANIQSLFPTGGLIFAQQFMIE